MYVYVTSTDNMIYKKLIGKKKIIGPFSCQNTKLFLQSRITEIPIIELPWWKTAARRSTNNTFCLRRNRHPAKKTCHAQVEHCRSKIVDPDPWRRCVRNIPYIIGLRPRFCSEGANEHNNGGGGPWRCSDTHNRGE